MNNFALQLASDASGSVGGAHRFAVRMCSDLNIIGINISCYTEKEHCFPTAKATR